MKNFTLLIALFFSLIITAQDHPGKRPELLLGKEVTVKELPLNLQATGYEGFYINEKLIIHYADNQKYKSKHDALANKTFKVLSVEPGIDMAGIPRYKVKLQAADETIVFYEFKDLNDYYFTVKGGLDYPADFYCDFINETRSGNTMSYRIDAKYNCRLHKITNEGRSAYFLDVSAVEDTPDRTKGLTIYLDNGAKIERPDVAPKMDVTSGGLYRHECKIDITDKELELLKQHVIKNFRIGAWSEDVVDGEFIKNALPCLLTK